MVYLHLHLRDFLGLSRKNVQLFTSLLVRLFIHCLEECFKCFWNFGSWIEDTKIKHMQDFCQNYSNILYSYFCHIFLKICMSVDCFWVGSRINQYPPMETHSHRELINEMPGKSPRAFLCPGVMLIRYQFHLELQRMFFSNSCWDSEMKFMISSV